MRLEAAKMLTLLTSLGEKTNKDTSHTLLCLTLYFMLHDGSSFFCYQSLHVTPCMTSILKILFVVFFRWFAYEISECLHSCSEMLLGLLFAMINSCSCFDKVLATLIGREYLKLF